MSNEDPVLCDKCAFVMHRDFKADFGKQFHGDTYPYASAAMGASPGEIPELRKFDKEHGVVTNYNSECDPIFTSKSHRKKYCEAHGFYDRNAGYSDPVPLRCQ
jgi:hypothetical protein